MAKLHWVHTHRFGCDTGVIEIRNKKTLDEFLKLEESTQARVLDLCDFNDDGDETLTITQFGSTDVVPVTSKDIKSAKKKE